jgi:hypothetical protein
MLDERQPDATSLVIGVDGDHVDHSERAGERRA